MIRKPELLKQGHISRKQNVGGIFSIPIMLLMTLWVSSLGCFIDSDDPDVVIIDGANGNIRAQYAICYEDNDCFADELCWYLDTCLDTDGPECQSVCLPDVDVHALNECFDDLNCAVGEICEIGSYGDFVHFFCM